MMTREEEIEKAREEISRTKPGFWDPSSYDPTPEPLNLATVVGAEKAMGRRLPDSYIALLMMQNGGELRYNGVDYTDSGSSMAVEPVYHINGIDSVLDSAEDIARMDGPWAPDLSKTSVVLSAEGHWWWGLDYRQCGPQGEPSVIHVECECVDAENQEARVTTVAPCFMAFIQMLFDLSEEYAYGFVAVGGDPARLLGALRTSLDVELAESEAGNIDMPVYRGTHKQWVRWDEYGKEPRMVFGAVVPQEPVLASLSLQRNRHAESGSLEFPSHPECDWVLVCNIHRTRQEELEAALREAPYEVVTLHVPRWDMIP